MKMTLILLVLGLSQTLFAATYNLDTQHGEVGFTVRHMMISNVKGRFNKFEGSLKFDDAKNEISDVDIKIDIKSIDTNDKKRDEHLLSDDFFASGKNPEMSFKSDKPAKLNGKKAEIHGILTIRGNSKPVVLETEYLGMTNMMGKDHIGYTAKTTINRKDFGLNWNKTLDKGGVAVSDEVTINIEGEAVKADAVKK